MSDFLRLRFQLSSTIAVLLLASGAVSSPVMASCWCSVHQSSIAGESPVIVSAEIMAVDTEPNKSETYDMAQLRVVKIHKKSLSDLKLKLGDWIPARVHGKNRKELISTDLVYEVGTKAVWYIYLDEDNKFSICRHPQQCLLDKFAAADPPELGADGVFTRQEWIAEQIAQRKQEEEQQRQYQVERAHIRALRDALVVKGKFQPASMQILLDSDKKARNDIVQSSPKGNGYTPMDEALYTRMLIAFLESDPDVSIRTRAASRLGYRGNYSQARGALLRALESPDVTTRVFACQSLGKRKDKSTAPVVRKLLEDGDARVRVMAVRALGSLGDGSDIPRLVEMYPALAAEESADWCFCSSLSRLGEKRLALELVVKLLNRSSDPRLPLRNLARIDSPSTVPVAMRFLVPTLELSFKSKHSGSDGSFLTLCGILEQRTGQEFGIDVIEWHRWWEEAHKEYAASKLPFNEQAARELLDQYQQEKQKSGPLSKTK
jgi:hypothetical protein